LKKTSTLERTMLIAAGFAMVYPGWISDVLGYGLIVAALALQYFRPTPSTVAA
jgi:UPF0716 family protein affecting phage T7 exclusion